MTGDLDAARDALARGDAKRALRLAWGAAFAAVAVVDEDALSAVAEIAAAIRDRSDGHVHDEADRLAVYAVYARDHPQELQIGGVPLRRDR